MWEEWDDFIASTPFAHFLSYSFWLNSYCIIPFLIKKVGLIIYKNNQVAGGITGIRVGILKFNWVVFPSGPFFADYLSDNEKEYFWEQLMQSKYISKSLCAQFASREVPVSLKEKFKIGKKIRWIYMDKGLGIVSLENNQNKQLESIKYRVSRYIKASLKRNLELQTQFSNADFKQIYEAMKANAKEQGYRIRPYFFYKKTWINSYKTGNSVFFLIKKDGVVKGAAWFIVCGGQMNYIMGGSSKEKPRLDVGYFVHWHAICKSISKGMFTYNISVGGSESVENFKDDFGRKVVYIPSYFYTD